VAAWFRGHPCEGPISWKIVQETKIPMFGVNFRKCVTKETAFPAALQDAIAAFYYLLDEGYRAENVSISGDSGGGCIAITTLLYLKRYGLEVPECAVLISPFVDLVNDYMGDEELMNLDFLNPEMLGMVEYQYTENRPDLRATLLSPALDDLPEGYTFKGFPRTLMAYGDAEMFAPSIIEMIKILRVAGVKVQIDIGQDQPHNYPYYTHNRSENGFYGKLKPFLHGHGRYEDS
jgi:monoterpene epsilon-lactone hydrolase